MPVPEASAALTRFTVLDLTRVRAGPTAPASLPIGAPTSSRSSCPSTRSRRDAMGGPRHGPDFQNLHRNKRSITLDLKSADGAAVFRRLAAKADVIVENFRPDVKARLGIDYATLAKLNPRLVYASISGFGQDGPYAKRPGFDQIAQGLGGLMSITGEPGRGPMRVGIPIADLSAGLFCALGILVALLEREQSGKGQEVATSLLQAQIFMLDFQGSRWLNAQEVPGQAGNNHPTSIPTGVFKTRDGHINIATAGATTWERLCRAIGAETLDAEARVRDRRRPPPESRRAQRRDRELPGRRHQRRMGRAHQCRGSAVRADLCHQRDLLRPASEASADGRRTWRRRTSAACCTWSASR